MLEEPAERATSQKTEETVEVKFWEGEVLNDAAIVIVGLLLGHLQCLPPVVNQQVSAFKKLQAECTQFHKNFYTLDKKYEFYQPLFDKSAEI